MRREGFLAYGARQTIENLHGLQACMATLVADDLQTVERTLDSAHRLQTCLTLFAKGYPTPRVAFWKRRLRRMVRALNALRDCLRLHQWVAAQQPPPAFKAGVQRARLRLRQRAQRCHETLLLAWQRWNRAHLPNEIEGLSRRWIRSFGGEPVDIEHALMQWRLLQHEHQAALRSPAPSLAIRCGRLRALQEAHDLLTPLQLPLEYPDNLQAHLEILDAQRFHAAALCLLREMLAEERAQTLQYAGSLRGFRRIESGWEWLIEQLVASVHPSGEPSLPTGFTHTQTKKR